MGNLDKGAKRKLDANEAGWEGDNRLIYWQGRIYIAKDAGLGEKLNCSHHDLPLLVTQDGTRCMS